MYKSVAEGGIMKDLKTWLTQNCTFREYDDPDIDPDLVASQHRKAVTTARSAIRDHLNQQLASALKDFYSDDHPPEKKLLS